MFSKISVSWTHIWMFVSWVDCCFRKKLSLEHLKKTGDKKTSLNCFCLLVFKALVLEIIFEMQLFFQKCEKSCFPPKKKGFRNQSSPKCFIFLWCFTSSKLNFLVSTRHSLFNTSKEILNVSFGCLHRVFSVPFV